MELIRYTNAPEAYDGFGTMTLDAEAGVDRDGRTVRKVKIPEDAYAWQVSRYSSGLYATFNIDDVNHVYGWTMRQES